LPIKYFKGPFKAQESPVKADWVYCASSDEKGEPQFIGTQFDTPLEIIDENGVKIKVENYENTEEEIFIDGKKLNGDDIRCPRNSNQNVMTFEFSVASGIIENQNKIPFTVERIPDPDVTMPATKIPASQTPTPTNTMTSTVPPTPTQTLTPSVSETPTPTATRASTPTPTATFTGTPTKSPTQSLSMTEKWYCRTDCCGGGIQSFEEITVNGNLQGVWPCDSTLTDEEQMTLLMEKVNLLNLVNNNKNHAQGFIAQCPPSPTPTQTPSISLSQSPSVSLSSTPGVSPTPDNTTDQ